MTPEKRARIALRQGETAARLGPIGLWEAQVELIARQIREAVAAERAACAEVARSFVKSNGVYEQTDVGARQNACDRRSKAIADAIEAQGKP